MIKYTFYKSYLFVALVGTIGILQPKISYSENEVKLISSLLTLSIAKEEVSGSSNLDTIYANANSEGSKQEAAQVSQYKESVAGNNYLVTTCDGGCGKVKGVDDAKGMGGGSGISVSTVNGDSTPSEGSSPSKIAMLKSRLDSLNSTINSLQSEAYSATNQLNQAAESRNSAAMLWNASKNDSKYWEQKAFDSSKELEKNLKQTEIQRNLKTLKTSEHTAKLVEKKKVLDKCIQSFQPLNDDPQSISSSSRVTALSTADFVSNFNSESASIASDSQIDEIQKEIQDFKINDQPNSNVDDLLNNPDMLLGDGFKTHPLSDKGMAVRQMSQLFDQVQSSSANLTGASKLAFDSSLQFGRNALKYADNQYASGRNAEGYYAMELAKASLDITLSFIPLVGWGKDVYEASFGTNLVTGEKLSNFERAAAVLGILTAGYGSKIALAAKAAIIIDVLKVGKTTDNVAKIADAGKVADSIIDSAKNGAWSKVVESGLKPGKLVEEGMSPLRTKLRQDKGIPDSWEFGPAKDADGISFHKPGTFKADEVRIMPGKPTNPYPNSQVPYVTWKRNGQWLDKDGGILPDNMRPEAHIPLDDFKYKD